MTSTSNDDARAINADDQVASVRPANADLTEEALDGITGGADATAVAGSKVKTSDKQQAAWLDVVKG